MGRDPKSRYNEPSAPETADGITLGASVQWYCLEAARPMPFPDIDWGLPISEETVQKVRRGQWYWEVGMAEDQMAEAERIRDYGMYVAYSNWAYIKNHASFRDEYANSYLGWMAHVAGKRESRRLVGEFVLREQDLTDFVVYPDGCVSTSWYIDNHRTGPRKQQTFPGAVPLARLSASARFLPDPLPVASTPRTSTTCSWRGGTSPSATSPSARRASCALRR